MTNVFRKLLKSYKQQGYQIRTGLNPFYMNNPDECFTALYRNGEILSTGRGLSMSEVTFLEELLTSSSHIKNILVIGNAFGWSTLAAALALPEANVVAMDAAIEGDDVLQGKALTLKIAEVEQLNVQVIDSLCPQDVEMVVQKYFQGKVDFVLIDGLHVNLQLIADFKEVLRFASDDCLFFCHDVLNWHMLEAMKQIEQLPQIHSIQVLTRLSSGPALASCMALPEQVSDIVDSYIDETFNYEEYIASTGGSTQNPGQEHTKRLAREYRFGLIEYVKMKPLEASDSAYCCDLLTNWVDLYPADSDLAYRAGACLLDLGYFSEAESFFKKTIRFSPSWAEAYHQLGRIYRSQKKYALAKEFFEKTMALEPNWLPAYIEFYFVEVESSNVDVAIKWLNISCPSAPDWQVLYQYHHGMGEQYGMVRILEENQLSFPRTVLPWEECVTCINDHDEFKKVTETLCRICMTYPEWLGAVKAFGIALRLQSKLERSLLVLKQPSNSYPNWPGPGVLFEIALTYIEMKDFEQATLALEEAIQLKPSFEKAKELYRKLSVGIYE